MTDKEIFDVVLAKAKAIMPNILGDKEVTMDTTINVDGFESLNFIMLVCEIEQYYGIKIPDRTWMKLQTMGDIVSTIQKALQKKSDK